MTIEALRGFLSESGTGLVVAAHGRHCMVETGSGSRLICHPRGKRAECVVGDRVRWASSGDEGVIETIAPRGNLMFRQDDWRTKSFAANLDQVLIVVAVDPPWSDAQIARAQIAAAEARIPSLILLNKTDLPAAAAARAKLAEFEPGGSEIVSVSLKHDPAGSLHLLEPRLRGRTTLVLGPSGMGKSTLINRMIPGALAQTGEVSQALRSGRHTTTTASWYWISDAREGAIIDSPGFQEFGLRQIRPQDLASLMPDLGVHADACRFADCAHLREPDCAVRAALARGAISEARYRIYERIRAELDAPVPRR